MPNLSDNALRMMKFIEGPASPEEFFLAWLFSLPNEVDVGQRAAAEVIRLDRAQPRSRRGKRLRQLFVAAAECALPKVRSD
jgi:hypothetical protein